MQDRSLYQFATVLVIYKEKNNLKKPVDSVFWSPNIHNCPIHSDVGNKGKKKM